ncbi:MAG: condensation domain-containing protein, partial [Candidatus Thorarchaeota archaeon]
MKYRKLDKKNIEDIYPLTTMQEGMLHHYLLDKESDLFFEQLSLKISGEIDLKVFEKAWNYIIERNEMLRTVFRWEELKNPVQVVLKKHNIEFKYLDFLKKESNKIEKISEEIKKKDRRDKFDLHEVPLRVTLCRFNQHEYELIISNHHILYDGWSQGIILKDFITTYNSYFYNGKPIEISKNKFKEFIKLIQNRDLDKQEKFWEEYFKDFKNQGKIQYNQRIQTPIISTEDYQLEFDDETREKFDKFVKQYKITPSSLFLSAYGILMQILNNSRDIIFDTTVSGRSVKLKGIENMVGLFINTLPLRVKSQVNEKTINLLFRVNKILQDWEEFENSSQVIIKENIDRNYGEINFKSVVVIENYPLDKRLLQKIGSGFINSFSFSGTTIYDLTIIITVFEDIKVKLIYNKILFTKKVILKLVSYLKIILNEIITNPQERVFDILGLLKKERMDFLNRFGRGQKFESPTPCKYESFGDEIEKKLHRIWSEILFLDKKRIAINSNFFDLGAHSLKANVLSVRIRKEFNVTIPLAQIFKHPTIKELSSYIKHSKKDRYIPIKSIEKKDYYPLSFEQRRLYMLQHLDLNSISYNGPLFLILESPIDTALIEKSFKKLVFRHEILRCSFETFDIEPVQKIHEYNDIKFEMEYLDLKSSKNLLINGESSLIKLEQQLEKLKRKFITSHLPRNKKSPGKIYIITPQNALFKNKIIKNFVRFFDLSKPPLFRVKLVKLRKFKYLLLTDFHHIIIDGTSMDILLREFIYLYFAGELQHLKVQYKDGVLTVAGQIEDSEKEYVQKGLAARKFFRQFALHKDVVV